MWFLALLAGFAPLCLAAPDLRAPQIYPQEVDESAPVGIGELRTRLSDGSLAGLVLEQTEVMVEISAGLAVVDVGQIFHNPFDEAIHATYLLPLPPEAAVFDLELRCGERLIHGEVQGVEEARKRYAEAAAAGHKAALLEQRREDLFRQDIANLCPGEEVEVHVRYLAPVEQRGGTWSLHLPTTVGPRYQPPWQSDEEAAEIATPYGLDGPELSIQVAIEEGRPVGSFWSDSHSLVVQEEGSFGLELELSPGARPDRDFQLHWSYAAAQPLPGLVLHDPPDGEPGYLALTIEPPSSLPAARVQPRELTFLLDSSCSMGGQNWELAGRTAMAALDTLRPTDTFNMVRFSEEATALFPTAQPATAGSLAQARRWISRFDGQGTRMDRGIARALEEGRDPSRLHLVLMLTDGYIGEDEQIHALIREQLGQSRLFAMGIGASPNLALLDRVALLGRGEALYPSPETPVEEAARDFAERIATPALTDLQIHWGGLPVTAVYPSVLPDLWSGAPLQVVARLPEGELARRKVSVQVTLSGRQAGRPLSTTATLSSGRAGQHPGVELLWARRAIRDLELQPPGGDRKRAEEAATALALRHQLVSAWTSLVAIDDMPAGCQAAGAVAVPHLLPDGLSPSVPLPGIGQVGMGGLSGLVGSTGSQLGAGGLGGRGSGGGGGGTAGIGASGYGSGGGSFAAKSEGAHIKSSVVRQSGHLPLPAAEAALNRHIHMLRYCYQRELSRSPDLSGEVEARLTLLPDGTVGEAKILHHSFAGQVVPDCFLQRLSRVTFPTAQGPTVITATWTMSPS